MMEKGMSSFSWQAMHLPVLFAMLQCIIDTFAFMCTSINGIKTNMSVWVSLPYVPHMSPYYSYVIGGDFFLNRHTSAMVLIKELINILKATKSLYPLFKPDKDCPAWLCQEREYVSSLQHEPEIEHAKILYLQAIECLKHAE